MTRRLQRVSRPLELSEGSTTDPLESGLGMATLPLRRTFLDTNILLYCEDNANTAKQTKALALVLEHRRQKTGVISLQVLQEYFTNATRKFGLDPSVARHKVEVYAHFHVVEPSVIDILAAIDFHRLHKVSFWDALIVTSARRSGCSILLTEDLQHGQTIDGIKIVNPFL